METKALKVLAPLGDDPEALARLILPLAERRPVVVTLFRVGEPEFLRDAARKIRRRGLDVRTWRGQGPDLAKEIAAIARAERFDLIAMITHGRRGPSRAILGSVAEEVLRESRTPVLLARPGAPARPWTLVAAALDGSARAEKILPLASRLAVESGTPLRLLRVGGPEAARYLELTRARLERKGVVTLAAPLRASLVAGGLLAYAREVGVDVLCVTTRGRRGIPRALLGSVAEQLIRRSPCPVLALRA